MRTHRYRIIVSGTLGELTRYVFEDLCAESDGADTALTGELDQAGLFGVLNRIMNFGLELMALSRLDDKPCNPAAPRPASAQIILRKARCCAGLAGEENKGPWTSALGFLPPSPASPDG